MVANYPKFMNDLGVPNIFIGAREFECVGATPPQDHPHIYLDMGEDSEIVCPYCSTLFCFDRSLPKNEANPRECEYDDPTDPRGQD